MTYYTGFNPHNSIASEIVAQSQRMSAENFICESCVNYQGKLVCSKGVFIAFVGANMSGCFGYVKGHKCRHCGRTS